MKKVLLTNLEIVQFSGSEINCMTIAKRFKELKYEVYVAALKFDSPLYDETKEYCDYTINLLEDKFDFDNVVFDIVWSQHSVLLDWLIFDKNIKAKKIINSCLSPKEIFEAPTIYANDLSMILANSFETKERLEYEGVKNVRLFENYSFKEYFKKNVQVETLKNIAVVSNHIPEEEKSAIEILRQRGYKVDIYGLEGKKVFITDEVLSNYDIIITIGKTVQYAMSLGIPVYIYDIHGGPGYLTIDNIEKNRQKNFSGRGYNKKSSIQICNQVENEFKQCLNSVNEIKEYALVNFCFEDIFDSILNELDKIEEINIQKLKQDYAKYERNLLISKKITNYIIGRYNVILNSKEKDIYELKEEINRLKQLQNESKTLKIKQKILKKLKG